MLLPSTRRASGNHAGLCGSGPSNNPARMAAFWRDGFHLVRFESGSLRKAIVGAGRRGGLNQPTLPSPIILSPDRHVPRGSGPARIRDLHTLGAAWYEAGGTGLTREFRDSKYPMPNKEVPMSKGTARRARLQFVPENHQPTTINRASLALMPHPLVGQTIEVGGMVGPGPGSIADPVAGDNDNDVVGP